MKWWNLTISEIRFRPGNFLLGLAAVTAAAACVSGAIALLAAHDLNTEKILEQRERETRREMMRLEDDIRKIMRELGYNVMILHETQSLAELQTLGHPTVPMPEEYAWKLGRSGIKTLNHLLPVLQQAAVWPEANNMRIILAGTPGQVPVASKPEFLTPDGTSYRNPIMPVVPEGVLILGHTAAKSRNLQPGDTTTFMGEEFKVAAVNPSEGNADDLLVWCSLKKAQKWLGMEGKINMILALECVCDFGALGRITEEVKRVLGDVQVLEFGSRAAVRAEARKRAAEAHRLALAAELEHRAAIGAQLRKFAAVLAPFAAVGAALWISLLAFSNARARKTEIGILRAMGVKASVIAWIFLLKAALTGGLGAAVGYPLGAAIAAVSAGIPPFGAGFAALLNWKLCAAAAAGAIALCVAAALAPALWAARIDPAAALRED